MNLIELKTLDGERVVIDLDKIEFAREFTGISVDVVGTYLVFDSGKDIIVENKLDDIYVDQE